MDLWDKFFTSGKISDYINYALAEKGGAENDNTQWSDTERKKHR